jgi:hypothetical protein
MLSHYFFGPERIPTRFDKCVELKQIFEMLARLRKKEAELDKARLNNGAGSPDYAKYAVINNLVRELDAVIGIFNQAPAHANHADEVRDMISLINSMTVIIANTLAQHRETINIFRNNYRENTAMAFRSATFATTLVAFFATPFSLIPRLGMIFGIGYAENSIEDYTGLNSHITRTLGLLTEFHALLREAKVNLQAAIRLGRNDGERLIAPQAQGDNALLYTYSPMTKSYIDAIRDKPQAEQITTLLEELNLSDEEKLLFKRFECPISLEVMNIPVMVGVEEFDLDYILALPTDNEDQRTHPITRQKFYVRDIHPTKSYGLILETIAHVKQARQNQASQEQVKNPAPSAPPQFGY